MFERESPQEIRATRRTIEAQLMAATEDDAEVNACANKLDARAPKR